MQYLQPALAAMLDYVFTNSGNEFLYPPHSVPDIPSVVYRLEEISKARDVNPREAYECVMQFKRFLEKTGEYWNIVDNAAQELYMAMLPDNNMPMYQSGVI